jgi:CubicO group peptidase (beta-lactamase class C family)
MTDTGFFVAADEVDRLAALYVPDAATLRAVRMPGPDPLKRPTFLSGGGGLVSTAHDYHRFTQLLLGGGTLDGVRLLGPRTVRYMTRNHLPGGVDLEAFGQSTFAETSFDGVGFGLGFSVMQDPVANRVLTTPGEFGWGGAASTAFWVDPREQITVVFMTQLLPSSTHPIRPQLKQLVYQALIDQGP